MRVLCLSSNFVFSLPLFSPVCERMLFLGGCHHLHVRGVFHASECSWVTQEKEGRYKRGREPEQDYEKIGLDLESGLGKNKSFIALLYAALLFSVAGSLLLLVLPTTTTCPWFFGGKNDRMLMFFKTLLCHLGLFYFVVLGSITLKLTVSIAYDLQGTLKRAQCVLVAANTPVFEMSGMLRLRYKCTSNIVDGAPDDSCHRADFWYKINQCCPYTFK